MSQDQWSLQYISEVCTRFDRVWDSLNELDQEPIRTEQIQRELGNLNAGHGAGSDASLIIRACE